VGNFCTRAVDWAFMAGSCQPRINALPSESVGAIQEFDVIVMILQWVQTNGALLRWFHLMCQYSPHNKKR
jgi:hypothetical protein